MLHPANTWKQRRNRYSLVVLRGNNNHHIALYKTRITSAPCRHPVLSTACNFYSPTHCNFYSRSFQYHRVMSFRPIYLAVFRRTTSQRAHFAIFIPNAECVQNDLDDRSIPCLRTLIHVIGTPMSGYAHEFKRNYNGTESVELTKMVRLGSVDSTCITDPPNKTFSKESTALGRLDAIALQELAPRASQNFMAPVNDVRTHCQRWIDNALTKVLLDDK